MRSLLGSSGKGSTHDKTSKPSHNDASGASVTASSAAEAAKFTDSWLGTMIKLKAKEARANAYNLRANFKSKKGFQVQVPKRMMFYTALVFLIGPMILFIYKEGHIHDHDPSYHHLKNNNNDNNDKNLVSHGSTAIDGALEHGNTIHNNGQHKNRAGHHVPLKQLLAGGMAIDQNENSAIAASSPPDAASQNLVPSGEQQGDAVPIPLTAVETKAENITDTITATGGASQEDPAVPASSSVVGEQVLEASDGQAVASQETESPQGETGAIDGNTVAEGQNEEQPVQQQQKPGSEAQEVAGNSILQDLPGAGFVSEAEPTDSQQQDVAAQQNADDGSNNDQEDNKEGARKI